MRHLIFSETTVPTTYVKDNYKSKITSTSVTYIKSAMTYTVNNLRRNSSPKRIQIIPRCYDKRILKKYLASIKHQLIQLCRLFLKAQFKYINSQIFYCIELSFVKDIDFDIFFPNGWSRYLLCLKSWWKCKWSVFK